MACLADAREAGSNEGSVTLRRLAARAGRAARQTVRDQVARVGSSGRALVRFAHVYRMRWSGTSDVRRWGNIDNFETWWDERTKRLAAMVPAGSGVIEFGAGRRQLERYLDPSCRYVPSDLVDRGPGTLVCDLNVRPLPDLASLAVDVAVFSGVLEYLSDVPTIVDWLAGSVTHIVASYAYVAGAADSQERRREYFERLRNGYLSHYSEPELVDVFEAHGFVVAARDSWQTQTLFLFVRDARAAAAAPEEMTQ